MTTRKLQSVALIAAALLVIVLLGAASADEMTWINAAGGNWGTAANWDPPNVPDNNGESALIPDDAGAYTVTLNLNFAVGSIRVLDPDVTIDLGGRLIHVDGAEGWFNNGIMQTSSTSQIWGHIQNTASARTVVETGQTLYLHGPTMINDGQIVVNEQAIGDAALDVAHALDLSGSGEILLNGNNENDLISSHHGSVLTQQAGHTIRGTAASRRR